MKSLLVLSFLISSSVFAGNSANQKVCESLYDKAIDNCKVSMCKDWLNNEGTPITKKSIQSCLDSSDGDLMEGAQICAVDGGEFEMLVKAYNVKNPKKKINCDEF